MFIGAQTARSGINSWSTTECGEVIHQNDLLVRELMTNKENTLQDRFGKAVWNAICEHVRSADSLSISQSLFVSLPSHCSHWNVGKNKAVYFTPEPFRSPSSINQPRWWLTAKAMRFYCFRFTSMAPHRQKVPPMWHDIYQCHAPDGTTLLFANPLGKLHVTRLYSWNGAIS